MTNLGSLAAGNSMANAINNAGQIVGQSASTQGYAGFIYQNGVMQNLNSLIGSASSEYTITNAVAINSTG